MTDYYETIARFYDAETGHKTDDLAMYSRLAAQYGGPVLDVGCGTGRVLVHLAQEGYPVHGVDTSRAMLDRLDIKLKAYPHLAEYITYTHGDIMSYTSREDYRLTLLTYNALMHFHEQDTQIALLERLHTITHSEGLLVIDLPNAGETFATQETDSVLLDRTFLDPETGHMIMLQSTSYLDRVTQLLRVQWIYDEVTADGTLKRRVVPHVLRYFFYPELHLLLRHTGFRVLDVFGDADGGPFEDGCERMIVFARPR